MKDVVRWPLAGCFVLVFLLTPNHSLGRTNDGKLSMLWRPASTQPVMRLRGTSFPIQAVAPATAKGWTAHLVPPYASWKLIKLTLSAAAYDSKSKRWKITAAIPVSTPEELYGLQLSHSGASDTNKIAVRVLTAYPKAYTVAHYTDTQNTAVLAGHTSKMKDIVAELNLLQPEFSINTGDLVTYGNAPPQGNNEYKNFIATLEKSRVTSFHIPGNHDIYFMRCWDRKNLQAQYEQYIGERAYSFDFGTDHYTGVELSGYTWMCPYTTLTTAQQVWLKADFSAAVKAGKKPLVLFGHQLEYNVKLASSNLHKICDAHKLPLYLYGHIHTDKVDKAGKLPTHYVATDDAGASRYRLLDISGGKVLSYGYAGVAKASFPTGKVSVNFKPASDGKSSDVTATFINGLSQGLKYLKLTFVMAAPTAGKSYQVTGGTLHQVVHTAKGPSYVYVRGISAKAQNKATVRVWLAATPDGGIPDTGIPDALPPDALQSDGGSPDAWSGEMGPDITADMPAPDSGTDSGKAPDLAGDQAADAGPGTEGGPAADGAPTTEGGPTADASPDQAPAEGCSCDLNGGAPAGGLWLLLALLWWARRRRG